MYCIIGRCVAGDLCHFPHLWLRPQDKCLDCEKIVHPLCGFITEGGDKYRCPSCNEKITGSINNNEPTMVTTEESQNTVSETSNLLTAEIAIKKKH